MPSIAPFQTPILFIVFNRPDTTQKVFDAIRKAKPKKLYLAADGARPNVKSDVANCDKVRAIVSNVDWECEVKTLFHEQNLNCGKAPSTAISWLFANEEEGIILEDDCLPSESFFLFCEELLERYRNDSRIMHIGGNNFLNGWQKDNDYSYYFSRSGHIWGWATWRRAWNKFDFDISLYSKLKDKNYFDRFFMNSLERIYRLRKFDKTSERNGAADWWDYQWDFARFINSGLAIVPKTNLVKNIGFGETATHTLNGNNRYAKLAANELEFPLNHPPYMIRDLESDKKYFMGFMKDTVLAKIGI